MGRHIGEVIQFYYGKLQTYQTWREWDNKSPDPIAASTAISILLLDFIRYLPTTTVKCFLKVWFGV